MPGFCSLFLLRRGMSNVLRRLFIIPEIEFSNAKQKLLLGSKERSDKKKQQHSESTHNMSSKPIGPVLAENEMLIGGRILKVKKKAASSSSSSSSSSAAAQKTKNLKKQFQDLAEGRKALRQGRHLCDCDGNDHRVLTNCIHVSASVIFVSVFDGDGSLFNI